MTAMSGIKKKCLWVVLAAFLTTIPASRSWADSVTIISPDKAQTHAYGRVAKSRLVWLAKDRALSADITFSTDLYAGGNEPLTRESFLFKFPGVTLDAATKQFLAQDSEGKRVPVASASGGLGGNIKPLAGTRVYIYRRHGEVRVVLTATTTPPNTDRVVTWVERDGGIEHLGSR